MQEIFNRIIAKLENASFMDDYDLILGLDDAIDIVNEVAEEYNQSLTNNNQSLTNDGWIPCSERLPEDKEAIYVDEDGIELIELIVQIEGAEIPNIAVFVDGEFKHPYEIDGYGFAAEVIAWQPLPKPYQPKEPHNE